MSSEDMASTGMEPAFRLRIVNVDYYLSEPNARFDDIYSEFRQNQIKRVPVLRVFGVTDTGLKACLHVHRVYPHLSIRFEAKLDDNYEYNKQQFMRQIVNELESRLMPTRVRTRNTTKESPNDQLIYDIKEVEAIPFYGFHDNYHKFLRIYFYNPLIVQKAAEQLLTAQLLDRQFQPYEAHIPYILQFFIANNLYGMNFLEAKRVYYRKTDCLDSRIDCTDIEAMSSSQIECDIEFKDILNRDLDLENKRIPGLEAIWTEQLGRCKDSQERLNLKGMASQERPEIPLTEMEVFHLERLYDGLAKLNLKLDESESVGSTQLSNLSDVNESDFAQMIVQCIEETDEPLVDKVTETIEEVISNSQTLAIDQTIEDVIRSSQKCKISETIEDVINESKRHRNNDKPINKRNVRNGQTSRRRLTYNSSADEESGESTEVEDNEWEPSVLYVDAGTQTDIKTNFDESIDSLFGFEQEMEEVVCDCDSDECCDQCCDQGSDQCECDCEKCEYEKGCKRIPQLDGAFDSDDSGSNFSPDYKEDTGDSDFEVGSKRSKRPTPKKGQKRGQSSRSNASKRRKTTTFTKVANDSDEEVMNDSNSYSISRTTPRRRAAARAASPTLSITSVDKDEDVFESSSGRKIKNSKNLSSRLFDQLKPSKRSSDSPIHMSFSESDGSDREGKKSSGLTFLQMKDFSYSPKKITNTKSRERSLTPYLSDSEEEVIPVKAKPGPKSSKLTDIARPGPKSSKASATPRPGPKSSKVDVVPKPGPKSSKAAKPGPKSSKTAPKAGPKSSKKRNSVSSETDSVLFSYETTSRSRRSAAKGVNYDDAIERTTEGIYSEVSAKKTTAKSASKRRSGKSEVESAIESIFPYISSPIDTSAEDNYYPSYDDSAELVWKNFNDDLVQIDMNFYDNTVLDTIGEETLDVNYTPGYIVRPYLARYEENEEYWSEVKLEVDEELNGATKGKKAGTRSKGALKDFYTLPHLNESPEKSGPKARSKSQTTSGAKKSFSNQFARLLTEASDMLDKPLGKRGAQTKGKAKTTPTAAKKPVSKPVSNTSAKSKPSAKKGAKSSARKTRQRVPRGVTTSTVFTTTSVPFYDTDIRVLTDLTGYKKKAYLKSLCEPFELEVQKLPDRHLNNYLNHNISPFLFDNIYYNDYSGILADEESPFTQDVLITMKNLIHSVVSVSQCVDSIVNEVEQELDPKPMLDIREEDYFQDSAEIEEQNDWEYSHYADEEQEVIGVAVVEEDLEEGVAVYEVNGPIDTQDIEILENGVNQNGFEIKANSPLSEIVAKTLETDELIEENEGLNDTNGTEAENGAQVSGYEDNCEEEPQQEDVAQNEPQSYQEMSGQQFSPSAQSDQYSNNNSNEYMEQKSPEYQSNQYEEEADQSTNSSASNQMMAPTGDVGLGISQVAMDPNASEQFKMQTNYGQEMGFSYGATQPQNMPFLQNPLQNPIVPTLMPHNSSHYSQPNVYPTQQNWTQMGHQMPVQQMHYNLNAIDSQPQQTPGVDNEFDVSNYSYMSYYPNNPNIPQFDGIFDDDSFHSEGNQFNIKCSSDDNIEQLSQGSRSEEMAETAPKQYVPNIASEALLGGNGGQNGAEDERYGYYINGVVVKIPKSLPEVCLQQIGREVVPLDPLTTNDEHQTINSIGDEFTEEDCKSFFKTGLIGNTKLFYLQSLCNKSLRIALKRFNSNDLSLNGIKLSQNSQTILSSLNTSNNISFNNKICFKQNVNKLSVQLKSNASEPVAQSVAPEPPIDIEMMDEIPESPLNEISNPLEMCETSDGIYSFYSNDTLSPHLSQSTLISNKSDESFNEITVPNDNHKQHSTPLNDRKCKTFSQTLNDSKEFSFDLSSDSTPNSLKLSQSCSKANEPFVRNNRQKHFKRNDSIIEGPTPNSTYEFELSSVGAINSPNDALSESDCQYLTTMSVEVQVSTRAKLTPDPQTDAIEVLFYSIYCDRPVTDSSQPKYITGLIAVEPDLELFECTDSDVIQTTRKRTSHSVTADRNIDVDYVDDEIVLLMKFVELVKHWDPDFIVGYKIDTQSWGYVLERANVLNMSVLTPLSRINDDKYSRNVESSQNTKCQLCGRITLNLWSIARSELTLNTYSYENVHFHVLHERIPSFSYAKLTQMFANRFDHYNRRRVVDYYLRRTVGSLRLLDKLDFIGKTSELARLFGIQFHEVFNRGTQFRVESIMLRSAKLLPYLPPSPNPRQVASQRAPEILPLILEPESKYYTDPIAVLDFQSLYPSMMIAYNYCYSTCLGKVDQLIKETNFLEFGCIELEVKKQLLYKYRNDIHISPNGVVFIKEYVRKGILPKMLSEILETRVMVKNAIKANNKKQFPNKALNRKLEARQLGLKLISNVTYGYTSANFSGRMPCVEIADSIVAKGRETLERAINLVRNTPEWGGKVVYGDTDSLFIHFPGLSKDEAFIRGQAIAEAVTAMNPKPVRLKFEKVYVPSVLETKKRYVGFSYETPEQSSPKFDAKGIETVRRDTCPAVSKILEKSLKILFQTNDVNGVKHYLMRQFQKILNGRISILNDFVFAREYRGAESYSDKSHVPSMEIAKRRLAVDPRSEPKIKERVPYVVIAGPPNEPIFKLIKEPMDLINNPSLRLNSQYYIERVIIPALNRVFELMGHNVNDWYREMPKRVHYNRYQYLLGRESKACARQTIPQFFNTTQCVVCDANSKGKDFCDDCQRTPHESIVSVSDQIRDTHRKYNSILNVCKTCTGCADTDIECQSIECPNLFRFHQSKLDLLEAKYMNNVIQKYF